MTSASNTDPASGSSIVEQYWPFDGPHNPEQVGSALAATTALIRYANNATRSPAGCGSASQVYEAVGGLVETVERLPQLLGQLERWAREAAQDPTLRHDQHRGDPDGGAAAAQRTAGLAADRFHETTAQVTLLRQTLATAHAELAHLCHQP